MNPMRLLILLTVVGTTGSILFAAEPAGTARQGQPTASAESAAAAKEAEQKKEEGETKKQEAPGAAGDKQPAAATQGEDVDPAPPAKTDADKGPSPQRFVPSEQVRADFDVSFPVDI
jgi:outer membrane protein OmpA-like peptidoglycan-associated protein